MRLTDGSRRGFTVIELLVTVAIVALLAAIAVPLYMKHIRYSRVAEATTRLGEIVTAARAYAMEHPGPGGDPTWPAESEGLFDLSSSPSFSYAITEGGASDALTASLQITATGEAGTRMEGVTVRVTIPRIDLNATPPLISGL